MKRITRLMLSVMLAVALAVITSQVVRADGFWNCVPYQWEGPQLCYWIDLDLLTAEQNSFGFEAAYRICQMLGLCP